MYDRCLIVLRGARDDTRRAALDVIAGATLWVSEQLENTGDVLVVRPREVARLLGGVFDTVVLDVHDGLNPDVLGQAHGFVRGGGRLVLRLPLHGRTPIDVHLAAFPYTPDDVTTRFYERFDRIVGAGDPVPPLPPFETTGNAEQAAVVAALRALIARRDGSCAVLLADRGRGKSAALGLALSGTERVVVAATHEASLREIVRFCPEAAGAVRPLAELSEGEVDVIVIDEAAQVPVPTLRALVLRHPRATIVFATTVRGYEGTGRGFALRFLPWLARVRVVGRFTLQAPMRWTAGDSLERRIFDALLLDAELPEVASHGAPEITAERVDRDRLARDERDLRALFGLLVHAHYRTTPSDLWRLLDAPNLALHVVRRGGVIVGACMVALEGGLDDATCAALARGETRIRAHALADALVVHMGHPEAGRLSMVRSVRIAVHPELRRLGLARRLVEHVHASYRPDLFGTLFGATADLIAFRRSLGYRLVRVSASRGARTGEPSVVMVRPESAAAHALCRDLERELARDLPFQVALMTADGDLLEPELGAALEAAPTPMSDAEAEALVVAYAHGPRTLESVGAALAHYLGHHPDRLAALPVVERTLIATRVLDRKSWPEVGRAVGMPTHVAMRAMRRAVRALISA